MESQPKPPALDYDHFLDIIKRRRSVRRFEKGKKVERETLLKIAEAGRWATRNARSATKPDGWWRKPHAPA